MEGNTVDTKKAMLIIKRDSTASSNKDSTNSRTLNALKKSSNKSYDQDDSAEGFLKMHVQYNPSTLSVLANADPVPVRYLMQASDSGVPNQIVKPSYVSMKVELIFDGLRARNVLMTEKVGSTHNAVGSMVDISKGNNISVLPQTNALVSVLMRESTKDVIFKWADMSFAGEVNEVSARYTMFNQDGTPIRSIVNLNIIQSCNDKGSEDYWNTAFDNLFISKNIPTKKEISSN